MRIYAMTATFGKLEHETLTLKPGLNIIEAPNEWGKSTWCAFLTAMLYGLDTRAKTTKTALADKERYAPWSGSPMSGRIDLNWQGRDITIERRTARRIPLGEFRAYETHTGLPVPELTAANCGQMLLGVEQTVFRRAGFIRFSDLPVTQDDALRRRLNALVTTGDESGAAEHLGRELKELKNRIRYNRSGLLPQAQAQREELEGKLQELEHLTQQCRKLKLRLAELKQWQQQLENHRCALNYAASQLDAQRIAQARDARDQGLQRLTALEHLVADLPSREMLQAETEQLETLLSQHQQLTQQLSSLDHPTLPPEAPKAFRGLSGEDAVQKARQDAASYTRCRGFAPIGGAVLALMAAIAVYFLLNPVWIAVPAALFLLFVGITLHQGSQIHRRRQTLEALYDSRDPEQWIGSAQGYRDALNAWQSSQVAAQTTRIELEHRLEEIQNQLLPLCQGTTPEQAIQQLHQAKRYWEDYQDAQRDQQQLNRHLQDLQTMARAAQKPALEDSLTYSDEQTLILLNDALLEQQRLQNRLGLYLGKMEALGDPKELETQLAALQQRIEKLEDHHAALTLAQETLLEARQELQRRFAPRIAKRAQVLLSQMTQGRYQKLTLGSDFQLQAATNTEDTLQDAWWRSDGTVDQLYLALRLAVAGELTPQAPLILDDALVRFDDRRALEALKILQQEAQTRQVLLFTCHNREAALLTSSAN